MFEREKEPSEWCKRETGHLNGIFQAGDSNSRIVLGMLAGLRMLHRCKGVW